MDKRKRLNENKVLNEREENKMSIEQRVISVLDELHYLEKIGKYAYIYYYEADYRDKLDSETIDNLITAAKSGDLTEAWYDLTLGFDDASYIHEYIANEIVEALEKVAPLTDEELDEVNDFLWSFIKIDIDYSTYLDDEVPVYIMVDTGDGNYDFTLNPNYSFNWGGETAEDEPLELASLTWLARTQGYTLDQVLEAFREGGSNNKFLNSIVREGLNNSTSMSAVTFLGTMRILDLLNAASGNGDVTINADTYVGLFDTWSGSGSLFDIELEQGLVIPGNIINRIGTARGGGDNGYTPDQVYGFSGSVYDSKINLLNDLDRDVLGESKTLNKDSLTEDVNIKYYAQEVKSWSREDFIDERDELLRMLDKAETQAQKEGHRNFEKRINNIQVKLDEVRYIIKNRLFSKDSLTEATETGFTIEYPNGEFYIGKPMDLYVMMTDFLIDWDNDKTTMTEYEAENVASIRENYKEVFYAALGGGNYWEGQEFEETFGRFSDYGIANALDYNEELNEVIFELFYERIADEGSGITELEDARKLLKTYNLNFKEEVKRDFPVFVIQDKLDKVVDFIADYMGYYGEELIEMLQYSVQPVGGGEIPEEELFILAAIKGLL